MDKYILVCIEKLGHHEQTFSIDDASTEKEAIEKAKKIVIEKQREEVEKFPFSPLIIKGILYKKIHKIDGKNYIVVKK